MIVFIISKLHFCILVKSMLSASHETKYKAKPSALFASRHHAEHFISHKTQAKQCFNFLKEFPEKYLDT